MYDFNIRTDKKISARRPDIVVVDKNERTTLIGVACTRDKNFEDKEKEKVNKYQDLKIELQRIWETSVTVVENNNNFNNSNNDNNNNNN